MAFLLMESSRDEMLKPYYEMVVNNGNNISFGRFKSILLEHLTNFGGLKNLSLASNYYLAGAARFYFNGDLTYNDDLALFHEYQLGRESETESNNYKDEFKTDVCERLNALILILRNEYIDRVGGEFSYPENFGTKSLEWYLSKYNKKIEKVLLGDKKDEEDKEKYNKNVGNGYTFEIIYSQNDCKKFYNATSPGAWCISYSLSNYNMYIKRLNIHYVIFKKDGWEKVPRNPQKEMWKGKKPQDEYGNSLICVLQSNVDGKPVYITSRWNHGSSDSGWVEADHAYSTEEFMEITGVSEDELMRIFDIWNETKAKKKNSASKSELVNVVRKLKEIQIRINGGEVPNKNFNGFTEIVGGRGDNLRKGLYGCYYRDETSGKLFYVLMDNGKLVFESVFEVTSFNVNPKESELLSNRIAIFDSSKNYYMLYNYRTHKLINVEGVVRFKYVPLYSTSDRIQNPIYYELMRTKNDVAIMDYRTDEPLKLPNGDVWAARVVDKRDTEMSYERNPQADLLGPKYGTEIEIIYDLSSREKYFFNLVTKQFFSPRELSINAHLDQQFETAGWEPIISYVSEMDGFFCIEYKNPRHIKNGVIDRSWRESPVYLYRNDGTECRVRGDNMFRWCKGRENRIMFFKKVHLNSEGTSLQQDKFISFVDMDNNNVVTIDGFETASIDSCFIKRFMYNDFLILTSGTVHYIYNLTEKEVVEKYDNGRWHCEDYEGKILQYLTNHNFPNYNKKNDDADEIMAEAIKKFLE